MKASGQIRSDDQLIFDEEAAAAASDASLRNQEVNPQSSRLGVFQHREAGP